MAQAVAGKNMLFRISAPTATVKRPECGGSAPLYLFLHFFSASIWTGTHPLSGTVIHGALEMFMSKTRLTMAQWDVFSSNPLEGNSLAVFFYARGLSDAQMQAIAKEMNLSETTFILPRDAETERERGVRVRIFTVQEELPFAGHPTLGTAFALRGESGAKEIVLDLNVGKVPVRFEETPGQTAFGEMTQIDPVFGMQHDREAVAQATGLRVEDFDPSLPIETVSTGLAYTVVPLKSLAVIQKLRVDLNHAAEYLEKTGGKFLYFVARETVDPAARVHARMLFYNGEDPATGSAAGCAAAWMVAHGVAEPDQRVLIEQGIEMQRPSRVFVRASRHDNRIVNVRVGSNAIEVMRGEVFL
jgi:trans-2,3-dihydro-3-hydroxyanthranilate isomerase